jgi:two-component system response regulator AlgR
MAEAAAPLRVLVVDDEPLAVERLQLLLARCEGVAIAGTANDGEAALRIAEAVAPDLVLLDIAMPGMDGIDVARALSQSSVSPAVIFATAFDNFAVTAFDIAAVDYLMKPVQLDRLQRALERARGQRAAAPAGGEAPGAPPMLRNSGCPTIRASSGSRRATSSGSLRSATICGSMSAAAPG